MPKIDDKKRAEMWAAFQEKQAERWVAETCDVSRSSVRRYRKLDRWDERLEEIRLKTDQLVNHKTAEKAAGIRTRHIQIVQAAQAKFVKALSEDKVDFTVADYDRLVKLELLLSGEPTERTEEIRRERPLAERSDDELWRLADGELEVGDQEAGNDGAGEKGVS
jgi:hypothetical protein